MKIKHFLVGAALALFALASQTAPALAKGSHSYSYHSSSSHSYHSSSPGYHYTRSYTTKSGTHVTGHYSTNADRHFGNNWSTKGNTNPFTRKSGTKVTPPHGEKW